MIADGGSLSAWFQGISTTNITPAATDVSLSGEATTQGMARKITAFAITSATTPTTFTWTVTYTFTGSSSTTFYAASHFTSNVIGDTTDTMVTEDLLSASATVATNGDQVVTTSTQTGP
jgi:NaMN:DMB phosphoribosyltransferase